jgi:hypothetical protein
MNKSSIKAGLLLALIITTQALAAEKPSTTESIKEHETTIQKNLQNLEHKDQLTTIKKESENIEITVLKTQNEMIRENQDRVLSTVYLAISGVFTLAAVLAGFGWWTNFKIYENDKKRLSEDLKNDISEIDSKVTLDLVRAKSEIERDMSTKLASQLDRISQETNELKIELINSKNKAEKIDSQISSNTEQQKVEVEELKAEVLKLRVECFSLERYIWEIKDIPGNLLMTLMQGLSAAYIAKREWEIGNFPKKIEDVVDSKYIKQNRKIHRSTLQILTREIDEISKYSEEVGIQITELLNKIEVIEE